MSVRSVGKSITGAVVSVALMKKIPLVDSCAVSVAVHVILWISSVRLVALKSCPKFLLPTDSCPSDVTAVLFVTGSTGLPTEPSIHSNDSTPTWSVEFAM